MIYIALGLLTVVIVALIGLIVLISLHFSKALNSVFAFTDNALDRSHALVQSTLDRLMSEGFDQYKGWSITEGQQGSVSEPEEEGIQVSPGEGLWGGTIPTAPPREIDEEEETVA
jgi:hypothetical protein